MLQNKQVNQFVDEGVDLLIISPNQMSAISKAVERAYDSGTRQAREKRDDGKRPTDPAPAGSKRRAEGEVCRELPQVRRL